MNSDNPSHIVWRNIERFIAFIQVALGLTMLCYILAIFYELSKGSTGLGEFILFLGRTHASLILLVLISWSGFLFWRQKNFGWIGAMFATLLVAGIFFLVYYYDTSIAFGIVRRNEIYLLIAVIGVLMFVILISRYFRQKYQPTKKEWLIASGLLCFLILDWLILSFIR